MPTINFDEIRENRPVVTTLEELNKEKYQKAEAENNYWDVLNSDIDRIKADKDKDGKITYDEYHEFTLVKDQQAQSQIPRQNKHENYYDTHHYYHLDYTFLIGIGLACLTAIIIAFIRRK